MKPTEFFDEEGSRSERHERGWKGERPIEATGHFRPGDRVGVTERRLDVRQCLRHAAVSPEDPAIFVKGAQARGVAFYGVYGVASDFLL